MNTITRFANTANFIFYFRYDPDLITELKSASLGARFNSVAKHWSVSVYSVETAKKLLEFAEMNLFKIPEREKKFLIAIVDGRMSPPERPVVDKENDEINQGELNPKEAAQKQMRKSFGQLSSKKKSFPPRKPTNNSGENPSQPPAQPNSSYFTPAED